MGNVPPSAAVSNGDNNTNHQTTTPRGQQDTNVSNNHTTTTINDGTNDNISATEVYINAQTSAHNNNNNNNNDTAETQPKSPPPPVAAASPYTNLIANDNSLYPTAYPTKAKELMSLVGDSNIDALVVDMDYDKDLVCSVLVNYNYNGFKYIKTNVWHQIINDVAIKQSERDYLNQSLSECNHQSPNRGNTNDTNNTRKDMYPNQYQ